ncbi:MAG: orotidine-5'-phosphate decarboxylase [Anaerolineae bacterium]|nr:orotidine-5'-phosphate decarboxylase [Anaerolineae bacterium]
MPNKTFIQKLTGAIERNNSLLCVGLDPDPVKFPGHFPPTVDEKALVAWGKGLIEQTADLVCCYKPNIAFYEQHGPAGLAALAQTIKAVPDDLPVLLDAKRGDIGSTAAAYARAVFEVLEADAVTLNPYLGRDGVDPFLTYPGKMVFILGYTSNPSAKTVQEFGSGAERLFEHIARQAQTWGSVEQIGFVVGATQPHALAQFRRLTPNWILAPGVGAQGGDLAATLAAGLTGRDSGMLIPVSRGVIYANNPRAAALALRDQINQARQKVKPAPQPASPATALILKLYEVGCLQFGQFTLASGKQSPFYIDLRRVAGDASLLKMVAEAYAGLLKPLSFDRIAAVPYAALPIGAAVTLLTNGSLIYPRKEVKAHGIGRAIEGVFARGDRVVVLEDLVTSGGSVLKAIETLAAAGLHVADVAVLIDREQGGDKNLAEKGYRLRAAFRLSEILDTLSELGKISAEQVATVKKYLEES